MISVEFQHDYSNGQVAYFAGQKTDLPLELVVFLERDSPGCLKRVEAPNEDKSVKSPTVNKMIESPTEDKGV